MLTCVEEGGNGNAADQVLQEEALSGDEDGNKGRQRVVEGQVAHLKKGTQGQLRQGEEKQCRESHKSEKCQERNCIRIISRG